MSYNPIYIKYLKWISSYYICHIGDVIKACLPFSFSPIVKKYDKKYLLSQKGKETQSSIFKNKPSQGLILSYLRNIQFPQTISEIKTNIKFSTPSLKQLIEKKYVDMILTEKNYNPLLNQYYNMDIRHYTLSNQQQNVYNKVIKNDNGFNPFLLHGVTGSGKTMTAFLTVIDKLVRAALENKLEKRVYCIYISPINSLYLQISVPHQ